MWFFIWAFTKWITNVPHQKVRSIRRMNSLGNHFSKKWFIWSKYDFEVVPRKVWNFVSKRFSGKTINFGQNSHFPMKMSILNTYNSKRKPAKTSNFVDIKYQKISLKHIPWELIGNLNLHKIYPILVLFWWIWVLVIP